MASGTGLGETEEARRGRMRVGGGDGPVAQEGAGPNGRRGQELK